MFDYFEPKLIKLIATLDWLLTFMNEESEIVNKILDSTVLVDWVNAGNLRERIQDLATTHHVIIILHIKNEVKRILANSSGLEKSTEFETVLKELNETGIVDMNRKYDRLEKKFKQLKQVLKRTRPKVGEVDSHTVCVASQIESHICSGDGGIERVLEKIKVAKQLRQWRIYAERITVQLPHT